MVIIQIVKVKFKKMWSNGWKKKPDEDIRFYGTFSQAERCHVWEETFDDPSNIEKRVELSIINTELQNEAELGHEGRRMVIDTDGTGERKETSTRHATVQQEFPTEENVEGSIARPVWRISYLVNDNFYYLPRVFVIIAGGRMYRSMRKKPTAIIDKAVPVSLKRFNHHKAVNVTSHSKCKS
ncbi:hypothetical protein C8Q75DRAFT_737988 [Abortiporus biennis]|nr:hypothetical protein C8Q75DRAFT_737988 [Abortiporus biennis]